MNITIIYRVNFGDTLESISEKFGLSAERIAIDNYLPENTNLVVGQTLVLLFPTLTYTVKENDTLFSISDETGISIYKLLQNNPILNGNTELFIGETIVLEYPDAEFGDIYTGGFAYPFIKEEILRRTLPYLTYLSVFAYGINPDGSLVVPDGDERLISIAYEYGTVPLLTLTSLTSEGVFSNDLVNTILSDYVLSAVLINNVRNTLIEKGYGGVEMDFEYISAEYAEAYADFIERLKSALGENYTVFCDLAPKTSSDMPGLLYEAHKYDILGKVADYAFLMTYEWGYSYGPPLAVSPVNNVKRVIQYGITEIPSNKIFMGIPSYGYDWRLPYIKGESKAVTVSNGEAVRLAEKFGSIIEFDEEYKAPYFKYIDANDHEHIVWFEDGESAFELLKIKDEFDLKGISVWNLMRYYPQLWLIINSKYNIVKLING